MATIFALGIHEDTGSLTYPRTTIRDAEMLAASMRLGASQALIERYLHSALTATSGSCSWRWSTRCGWSACAGLDIHTVALDVPGYVDGLSVIAHKLMELINAEVLLQAVRHGRAGLRDRPLPRRLRRRGRAAPCHRRGGPRAGGLGGHPRADPRLRSRRCSPSFRRRNLGAPTAGRDHEPACPPHRRRHSGHRGADRRPSTTDIPASASGKRAAWWASWPAGTWTRPCATGWDTPRSRG